MKRKNASILGNVLMGLGLFVMVAGVGYSILNQLPQLDLPAILRAWRGIEYLPWCSAMACRCAREWT